VRIVGILPLMPRLTADRAIIGTQRFVAIRALTAQRVTCRSTRITRAVPKMPRHSVDHAMTGMQRLLIAMSLTQWVTCHSMVNPRAALGTRVFDASVH
jgi:hypothetical protein